ncbi:hypothetical protein ACQP1U_15605 [Actinomycetota bacterium]
MTPRLSASALRRSVPALAIAAAMGLSGCQVMSPRQTDTTYNAADGVPIDLGDVQLRDVVVVADKEGGPGTLVGAANNDGDKPATVRIAASGSSNAAEFEIPAHGSLAISKDDKVELTDFEGAPGGMVSLQAQTDASGASGEIKVPIVAANGYYKDFAPAGASSASESPSESPSATATSTASPSATSSASPSETATATTSPTS